MPSPTSVSAAVEDMVKDVPPVVETPKAKPPVAITPSSKEAAVTPDPEGAADRTAFEQELIDGLDPEVKQEFDSATPAEQARMVTWMKRQYRSQAKSMTELGTHRKVMAALRDAGVTSEDLLALTKSKRGGAAAPTSATASEQKRGYARWRDKASTPEEREQLTEAEQVQRELIEDIVAEVLKREVHPLRDKLDVSERQQISERGQALETTINSLEDELGYPGSLVETHREEMYRLGLREPKLSAEDLLVRVAGFATVKAAMLKASKTEPDTTPKSRLVSPVIKKPVDAEPAKNGRGRASVRKFVDSLLG